MLTELSIRNVAIIDKLQICFGPGLNLLTGETGAGKSIIVDSLSLICGGRASADLIRSGEEEATVEALFNLDGLNLLQNSLRESGFDVADELLVKRCLSRSGRNRVYINGSLATLGQLSDLGRQLITIHGQHESQALLRPEHHLLLLDSFAGTAEQRQQFNTAFDLWRRMSEQISDFDQQEREIIRRIDLLSYQIDEIRGASLKGSEEQHLLEQQRLLSNAERLSSVTGSGYESLYGSDRALLGELKRIKTAISDAAAIDPALASLHAALEEGYLQLEDTALQLRDYASRIESDPAQLKAVEDRLDLLERLKRKYAPTVEEMIRLCSSMEAELDELKGLSRSREEIENELARQFDKLKLQGAELGDKRRSAASLLEQLLAGEIRQLAINHAVVKVAIDALAEPRSNGYEKVEFMFSPNPGEPPKPLAKIASGGELSRIMLAFKQVLPEGEAPTLVFDEVDTGVGGAVAGVVGKKLKSVANGRQVFCVTHSPQVAAWASRHIKVEKHIENGRTVTSVDTLDREGQVHEIARMLAGEQITGAALQHATEMLDTALI